MSRTLATREAIAAVLAEVWRYEVSVDQVDRLMTRERNPLPYWNPTGGRVLCDEEQLRTWAAPQGPPHPQLPGVEPRGALDARASRGARTARSAR